jgi:hypothetical protein
MSIRRLAVMSAFVPSLALAEKTFVPVDMVALGVGNSSIAGVGYVTPSIFPFGNPSTAGGGVPFILTTANSQMWASYFAPGGNGQGDVSQVFSVSVNNVYGAYTLANSYWGVAGSYASYRFDFSDGTHYVYQLTNGVHLRDFNKFTDTFANTVNGTTTKVFYNDPFTQARIDRQWVDLDAAGYGGKNLTALTITDTGGWGVSRIFVAAMTFQAGEAGEVAIVPIPEPSTYGLLLGGLALGGAALRRRRKA